MRRNATSTPNNGLEMQASSATKDSEEPGSSGLNWRQRKKANMRRQQEMQRRNQLVDGYVAALGGPDRVGPIVMTEVMRAVDMTQLAEGMRAKALRGDAIDIGELVRLEGAVSRVIRSLNLPPPGAAPVPTLQDYVARLAAERAERADEAPDETEKDNE